jgi:uncharacterized protein YlxW (UPF0749 family)
MNSLSQDNLALGQKNTPSALDRYAEWRLSLCVMAFVLGVLIALDVKAARPWNTHGVTVQNLKQSQRAIQGLKAHLKELQAEQRKLLRNGTDFSNSRVLSKLNKTQFLAGLTPVKGNGAVVVLKDSVKFVGDLPPSIDPFSQHPNVIHDTRILNVVADLNSAGAEAVEINGERVVSTTAIRCVGNSIQINGVPKTPPFYIKAIGSPRRLFTEFTAPGGVYENMRSFDPEMITISRVNGVEISAYAALPFQYAKPADPIAAGSARQNQ